MHNSKIVFLINDEVRAINVRYEPEEDSRGASPTMAKTFSADVKVDDIVVIESSTRWKMTTAKVVAVDVDVDFDSNAQLPWIVSVVDQNLHKKILGQEADAISEVRAAKLQAQKEKLREELVGLSEAKLGALQLANQSSEGES